jgi:hypothetical protein
MDLGRFVDLRGNSFRAGKYSKQLYGSYEFSQIRGSPKSPAGELDAFLFALDVQNRGRNYFSADLCSLAAAPKPWLGV